jgi:hypothetical protein
LPRYSLSAIGSPTQRPDLKVTLRCARKPLVADQAGIVEDAGLPSRTHGLVGQSS